MPLECNDHYLHRSIKLEHPLSPDTQEQEICQVWGLTWPVGSMLPPTVRARLRGNGTVTPIQPLRLPSSVFRSGAN
jgi:hypothetical protein